MSDNYLNPNDCEVCPLVDLDILYFHRPTDRWMCLKCFVASGETVKCLSCDEVEHE